MINDDHCMFHVENELRKLLQDDAETKPEDPEQVKALLAELKQLGMFDLLISLTSEPEFDADLCDEISEHFGEKLEGLLSESARTALDDDAGLGAKIDAFIADKKDTRRVLLHKTFCNFLFQYFDLTDYGLFVDDVSRLIKLCSASSLSGNARSFARLLVGLSRKTARFVLGTLPGNLELNYKVARDAASEEEIDRFFANFAPKVIGRRMMAVMETLIRQELRLRAALTIYGISRGVSVGKTKLVEVADFLEVVKVDRLVSRAQETRASRTALMQAWQERSEQLQAYDRLFQPPDKEA